MTAANTDKFMKVGIATATTLDSPGYTIGGTSITVASTSNIPTDTGIVFAMDEIDANGDQVAGSYNEYVGTVASGTSIANVSHENGTDRNYSAGITSRVYMPVSAERENRLVEGILVEHNQDGTHSAITSTSAILTTPKVITSINDTNANELIKVTAIASAVNEITVANAATGAGPTISATGGDTNIDLNFAPKGTGSLKGVVNNLYNPYKFSVYRHAAWTSAGSSYGLVQFDTKLYDTGTNVDVATNKGRFTAPIDGYYQFNGCVRSNTAAGGLVGNAFYVNGTLKRRAEVENGANTTPIGPPISALIKLTANDYVELYHYGSASTGSIDDAAFFEGFLVSRL